MMPLVLSGFGLRARRASQRSSSRSTAQHAPRCLSALAELRRDFPEYETVAGVLRRARPAATCLAPPLMWAAALDRMMARPGFSAPKSTSRHIRAISGSAQQHGSVYLNRRGRRPAGGRSIPPRPLAPQLPHVLAPRSAGLDGREHDRAMPRDRSRARRRGATRSLTGSPPTSVSPGRRSASSFNEQPDAYASTARIHLVSSFLRRCCSATIAPIDPGDGSGMNLMDLSATSLVAGRARRHGARSCDQAAAARPSWRSPARSSPYWQQRHGFPPATVVAWSGDNPCSLIGTGMIRAGSLAISLGTSDTVFACTPHPARRPSHVFRSPTGDFMNLVCFRNGSLAREWVRDRASALTGTASRGCSRQQPGNNGALMLPWFEPEITPHVAHAGVRRFGFDR